MKRNLIIAAIAIPLVALVVFAFNPNTPEPNVGITWFFPGDPTAGSGVNAPLYQFGVQTGTPTFYYKSGAAATAWTSLSGGGGGGGTVTSIDCGDGLACTPEPIVDSGDISLDITPTTCGSGQVLTAISDLGIGTCTPAGSAGSITGSGTTTDLTVWTSPNTIGDATIKNVASTGTTTFSNPANTATLAITPGATNSLWDFDMLGSNGSADTEIRMCRHNTVGSGCSFVMVQPDTSTTAFEFDVGRSDGLNGADWKLPLVIDLSGAFSTNVWTQNVLLAEDQRTGGPSGLALSGYENGGIVAGSNGLNIGGAGIGSLGQCQAYASSGSGTIVCIGGLFAAIGSNALGLPGVVVENFALITQEGPVVLNTEGSGATYLHGLTGPEWGGNATTPTGSDGYGGAGACTPGSIWADTTAITGALYTCTGARTWELVATGASTAITNTAGIGYIPVTTDISGDMGESPIEIVAYGAAGSAAIVFQDGNTNELGFIVPANTSEPNLSRVSFGGAAINNDLVNEGSINFTAGRADEQIDISASGSNVPIVEGHSATPTFTLDALSMTVGADATAIDVGNAATITTVIGHEVANGTGVSLSASTGTPTCSSSACVDAVGTVAVPVGATSVTVTFATSWGNTPTCVVASGGATPFVVGVSASSISAVTFSAVNAVGAGASLTYRCVGTP